MCPPHLPRGAVVESVRPVARAAPGSSAPRLRSRDDRLGRSLPRGGAHSRFDLGDLDETSPPRTLGIRCGTDGAPRRGRTVPPCPPPSLLGSGCARPRDCDTHGSPVGLPGRGHPWSLVRVRPRAFRRTRTRRPIRACIPRLHAWPPAIPPDALAEGLGGRSSGKMSREGAWSPLAAGPRGFVLWRRQAVPGYAGGVPCIETRPPVIRTSYRASLGSAPRRSPVRGRRWRGSHGGGGVAASP